MCRIPRSGPSRRRSRAEDTGKEAARRASLLAWRLARPCQPRPRAVQKSGVPGPTHTRRVRTCAPVQAARRPSRTSTPEKLRSAEPAVSGVSLQSSLLKDSVINGFVTVTFPRLNISTCN